MRIQRILILTLLVSFFFSGVAEAKLSKKGFDNTEKTTSGNIFMTQVDIVSLYLSTNNIVYVPQLTEDYTLRVHMNLLGLPFGNDREKTEEFVGRHVQVFSKTLADRIGYFSPKMAKTFKAEEDIEFIVQVGTEQKPIGIWQKGVWHWEGEGEGFKQALENRSASCKKKCPALWGSTKVDKAELMEMTPETPPSENSDKPAE